LQAGNFLGALSQVSGDGLPPAVDLEFGGNCGQRPTRAAFDAELAVFIGHIQRGTGGCPVVLYATREFHAAYLAGGARAEPLWMRDIYRRPRLAGGEAWTLWQFANRGRLAGVATFIDLNVFDGSAADFAAFRCRRA
jgi:lysozyme